jgi:hypothetical protein
MTNWIMVILTLAIVVFTCLVWKVYERIAWFTGAMESHSNLMLRIEAKRGINGKPIKLVWWDPTIAQPPIRQEHEQEIDIDTIYIYLPPGLRQRQPSAWERVKQTFRL